MVIGTIGITSVLTVVVALVAVLGIDLAGRPGRQVWRHGTPPGHRRVAVCAGRAGTRCAAAAHLIKCDGRRVLLLTGGAHDVVVGWLDREPPS